MSDTSRAARLEIANPNYLRGPFRCAVFDFDGIARADFRKVS